jgi:hypothetical protein
VLGFGAGSFPAAFPVCGSSKSDNNPDCVQPQRRRIDYFPDCVELIPKEFDFLVPYVPIYPTQIAEPLDFGR